MATVGEAACWGCVCGEGVGGWVPEAEGRLVGGGAGREGWRLSEGWKGEGRGEGEGVITKVEAEACLYTVL